MIINIIIPVFNRLKDTQNIIEDLRNQTTDERLEIYVINDGSSDGTAKWLQNQQDINVLNGNGFLYWAGAVNKAIKYILEKDNNNMDDWIILLNNDISIAPNYIDNLLKVGINFSPAAVGSVIKNKYSKKLISIGPKLLPWSLVVDDLINKNFIENKKELFMNVDALSGRGVLFPIKSLIETNGLKPFLIPHYFADYELSIRVKKKGYKLIITQKSVVYSAEDFGQVIKKRKKDSLFFKLFSRKSSYLFYSKFFFWWIASNNIQRLSLPLRIFLFIVKPDLRKKF